MSFTVVVSLQTIYILCFLPLCYGSLKYWQVISDLSSHHANSLELTTSAFVYIHWSRLVRGQSYTEEERKD